MKTRSLHPSIALIICLLLPAFAAAKTQDTQVPDLRVAATMPAEAKHDWTLGPTGARGWFYTANGHSQLARQILVTAVAKGSPADGHLEKGDVIIGLDGKAFSGDARQTLASAIAVAESENGGGKLTLLRWRAEKSAVVELKLPILGTYSATAPYDCAKSRRILEHGSASLAKRMAAADYTRGLNAIPRAQNALALLAIGNKEHLPLIQREAKWASEYSTDGFATWFYGYTLIFLAEYAAMTGDSSVMPGLKRLALESARGQSGVGTWGHKFALPSGNLSGYGAMNQPGLSLTIGMVLAREAGVKEPELDRAIEKAAAFLRWYVNKGAVPYGDHQPFPFHEDNGKCAAAAVLFDLLGDREAAEFFSKMATAAYSERERGHTGNYFNYVWALQGVARSGPKAMGAYLKEQSWYYDFARGWDTAFVYQASPEGEEEHHKYTNWDCTGSHLLAFALPLKSLRLTGKKPFTITPLTDSQVAGIIAAGRDLSYRGDPDFYEKRSTEELLEGLASWSPFVRKRSAAALGKRDGDFVPGLLKLLIGKDRDSRYGACQALGALGKRADIAAPQLRAALREDDPWLQCLAAEAIRELSPAERNGSVTDLLAVTVRQNPSDPRRHAALYVSTVLFSRFPGTKAPQSILEASLEGVDREKLYPAIQSLLKHSDSIARSSVSKTYSSLTDRDIVTLLPDIISATRGLAPSNEMFADGVRVAGLDLLSRLGIREGMELCVIVLEPDRWGFKNRADKCLKFILRYGAHAKTMLPKLLESRRLAMDRKASAEVLAQFDKTIAAIESSTAEPTLVGVSEFTQKR